MAATGLNSGLSDSAPAVAPLVAAGALRPQASLRTILLVTGLTFLQLVLQFGIQLVMARAFGAADEMDAFVAALAPPIVIATILSGSLGYVLVPLVAERVAAGNHRDAAAVSSHVGLWVAGLAVFLSVAMVLSADLLAPLLFPGFSIAQQQLTAALLRVTAILVFANSSISYLNALSHCYGQFLRPAIAGVIGPLATLTYILWLHQSQGIFAVAWGVVVGAVVIVAFLCPLFLAKLSESTAGTVTLLPGTRQCFQLLLPLVLAAIYWRLDPLLDRWLGSYLPAGNISHLGYAWRLANALSLVGTSGLSIITFPAIAAHAAAGRRSELNAELAHAVRLLLFLIVPVCVGLVAFSTPVVRLLYERGMFTTADTRAVSLLAVLYVGVVIGTGMSDLFSRTYYAFKDMVTPVVVTTAMFSSVVVLKFVAVRYWGVAGLVAATSLYYVLTTVVLVLILIVRLSPDILAGAGGELARSLAGSLLGCLAAAVMMQLDFPLTVMPAAAVGAAVYFASMWLIGDEFARRMGQRALTFVGKRT